MDIEGGLILTAEQISSWLSAYPTEYADYVDSGLFNPDTGELLDIPEWMNDGDPNNGPFDFKLNPSNDTTGW